MNPTLFYDEKETKKGRRGYTPPPNPVVSRIKLPYISNGEIFARVVEIYSQERPINASSLKK
ncbi:MAG: hypothetical protein ACFFCI_13315 [Promethearchaeota archaeon]